MQENYLAKWLNNELSEEEFATFQKSDAFASYQKLIEVSRGLKAPPYDVDRALLALNAQKEKTKDVKIIALNPLKRFIRIAAVVALLFAASYFYMTTLNKTVGTHYAENKEVVLPDGSEIALNAASEISYNEKKWDQQRTISLEGEAFFKVAKGKRFTVETKDGLVTVLGTQFNVVQRDGFFEVHCFEGLVGVSYENKETQLPAGTSFLVLNGVPQKRSPFSALTPSWMNAESSFQSIPLHFVLEEFQRQFNVRIATKDIDKNQLFTGTFSNTNIELALQSISVPSQLQYTVDGNKVLFYGSNAP
ncbi:FecR domain-containing protein [Arenibacter sp. GZD96]|uniref:FecR family protein n=1 Tax=Aurantibrevibacter litoralis TaxID=3106030 RepID=UPI002AFEA01B|nr:FecR domain-containing protein [Arenibacter sp. GZD-96]MEA1785853.1 FecR domain-containing protein [Arenibacter sp. GZD-96]